MNKKQEQQLDDLLERYLTQEASEGEEQDLMDLLDEVADEYMPEGMEERLESFIQDLDKTETPVVRIEPRVKKGFAHTTFYWKYATAACVVLALGISIALQHWGGSETFADTCKTPEEAQTQMLRALTMISTRSQQGMDDAIDMMDRPMQQKDMSKYFSFE